VNSVSYYKGICSWIQTLRPGGNNLPCTCSSAENRNRCAFSWCQATSSLCWADL